MKTATSDYTISRRPQGTGSHRTAIMRISPRNWTWSLAVMAVAMFGGGNWTMPASRLLTELIAIAILVCAIGSAESRFPQRWSSEEKLVLAAALLIGLHLVPLPPWIWTKLPGRVLPRDIDLAVLGHIGWRPLSLDPAATLRSAISLLPATAMYLAARTAPPTRLKAILRGTVLALVAAVIVALAQLLFPEAEWLHFYPRGDYDFPVGFFTNHNHQAIFLLCSVPLAAAWLALALPPPRDPARGKPGSALATKLLFVIALLAALMTLATGSRAGVALLPLVLGLTALSWARSRHGRRLLPTGALLAGLLAIGVVAAIIAGLGGDLVLGAWNRSSVDSDPRWEFWPDVVRAIPAFWPLGSGIGTFVEAFAMNEPLTSVAPHYVNHAHNEILETALEAGIPGLVLLAAFIWRMAEITVRAWSSAIEDDQARLLHRLAVIPPITIILHSLLDYPARTLAISSMLGLCWAILALPCGTPAHSGRKRRSSFA